MFEIVVSLIAFLTLCAVWFVLPSGAAETEPLRQRQALREAA